MSAAEGPASDRRGPDFGKGRLEAFSDGVIAIIITIMVLELKAPHGTDPAALVALWPVALSYLLSFVFVAIYWLNHHTLMHEVRHVGFGVLWSNMALLFVLSLTPFATAYLGENDFARLPTLLYALLQFACAASYDLLAAAIAAQHRDDPAFMARHRAATPKNLISLGVYAVAGAIALVVPWLALAILAGIGLSYVLPTLFWRRG